MNSSHLIVFRSIQFHDYQGLETHSPARLTRIVFTIWRVKIWVTSCIRLKEVKR